MWLQRIALLPLVQLPFVFLLLLISYNLLRGETHYVVWSAGLLFACVIVDLLLFVQISRSMESRRTEIEAALLEERLAGYLRESAAVQGLLDDTARLRHDLRNHQAVVATLCERGDLRAALDYLEGAVVALRPVRLDAAGVFSGAIDGVPTGTHVCAQGTEGGRSWKR